MGGPGRRTPAPPPSPTCAPSGTPQLFKLRVTVSWGPNADVNNVQDSVILNYPPSGVQTLGFIALQMTGDSQAADSQGNPWSARVQAPPSPSPGSEREAEPHLLPRQLRVRFAQVLPTASTTSYTVSVANASSGTPAGSTYGSPSFVANSSGTVTNHVLQQPTSEQQSRGDRQHRSGHQAGRHQLPRLRPGQRGEPVPTPRRPRSRGGVAAPVVGRITSVSTGENSAGPTSPSVQSGHLVRRHPARSGHPHLVDRLRPRQRSGCEGVGYLLGGTTSTPVRCSSTPTPPPRHSPR